MKQSEERLTLMVAATWRMNEGQERQSLEYTHDYTLKIPIKIAMEGIINTYPLNEACTTGES